MLAANFGLPRFIAAWRSVELEVHGHADEDGEEDEHDDQRHFPKRASDAGVDGLVEEALKKRAQFWRHGGERCGRDAGASMA